MKILLAGIFLFCTAGAAYAVPMSSSTGDLGNNAISDAGFFEVFLNAETPSNTIASTIDITYGLWNSPSVDVSVFFNSTAVGNLTADRGYISPGPEFVSFDITGLLVAGLNSISFDGFGANNGDYVIGQVDMNYDNAGTVSASEPAILSLFALGLAGLGFLRSKAA